MIKRSLQHNLNAFISMKVESFSSLSWEIKHKPRPDTRRIKFYTKKSEKRYF